MDHLKTLAVFICVEIVAILIFHLLTRFYIKKDTEGSTLKSKIIGMAKGTLERGCLFFSLYLNFPQMLIAFGALKVGTRLGQDKDCKISNDYYLVGNLVSVFLVFLTYFLCRDLMGCIPICK
jgi:hypothetical protein